MLTVIMRIAHNLSHGYPVSNTARNSGRTQVSRVNASRVRNTIAHLFTHLGAMGVWRAQDAQSILGIISN